MGAGSRRGLSGFLEDNLPKVKSIGTTLIGAIASVGIGYFKMIVALIISGFVLVNSASGEKFAYKVATKLIGKNGDEFVLLTQKTIQSVVKGILGVAFIQAFFLGIGLMIAGVPATGLWVMLALISSIVQIGIWPVVIPIIIYVFATADTFTAVILFIWCMLVALLDTVLKPIFLGRNAVVPTAIIFVGAVGGFIYSGIVGLFTGAVIFSIGYKIINAWIEEHR